MPWIPTTQEKPPQSLPVPTKMDDTQGLRNEQVLQLRGNLWWLADGSMYVYYTPTHWYKY